MKNSDINKAQTPQTLLHDLRSLVVDAEKLMNDATGDAAAETFNGLRERFAAAQECCSDLYADARKKVVASAKHTDETIRANPYQSLAIALGVGLLLGVVVGRRGQ